MQESTQIAKALENVGVDFIHVSSGIGGWRRPSPRNGVGYLVPEAAQIQSHVKVPVIGVGGIETGAYIDQALSDGLFSLAAVGRAILKDPGAWRQNNLNLSSQKTCADTPFKVPAQGLCSL
jgi:NADPH2 dehydrogenase